jgi:hypothetical protein
VDDGVDAIDVVDVFVGTALFDSEPLEQAVPTTKTIAISTRYLRIGERHLHTSREARDSQALFSRP